VPILSERQFVRAASIPPHYPKYGPFAVNPQAKVSPAERAKQVITPFAVKNRFRKSG
jgi:hypothetical protein